MLGYVVTYKPELKVKEAEAYKAYYCGVCKSIGKRYGQLPRMVLSYDAAFLSVVLDSLSDKQEDLTREGCIANPFKKKFIAHSSAIDYAADVMLILAWYKLIDDARDEGKLEAKALLKVMKPKFKKLYEARPKLCDAIESNLLDLTKLEEDKCSNLDQVSETFAKIMEVIFTEGIDVVYNIDGVNTVKYKSEEIILARVGYHLGKWIYLMDAYDDIEDNIITGAYNPLLYRFHYGEGENKDESPTTFKARIKKDVERNLLIYLSEIAKSFDLLDMKKNKGIVENIIYVGLLKRTEEVLEKVEEKL